MAICDRHKTEEPTVKYRSHFGNVCDKAHEEMLAERGLPHHTQGEDGRPQLGTGIPGGYNGPERRAKVVGVAQEHVPERRAGYPGYRSGPGQTS